jgi:RNA polymerase sigma factor (sigma-70 family)
VFLKLWRTPKAQGKNTDGWLYRVAVRKGLDELRRQTRRNWYESRFGFGRVPSPEDIHAASEKQERVRLFLAVIDPRQAELLLLRSHGLSYDELASAFELNVASIGTFLSRAQHSFRKEYITRYGARWWWRLRRLILLIESAESAGKRFAVLRAFDRIHLFNFDLQREN